MLELVLARMLEPPTRTTGRRISSGWHIRTTRTLCAWFGMPCSGEHHWRSRLVGSLLVEHGRLGRPRDPGRSRPHSPRL